MVPFTDKQLKVLMKLGLSEIQAILYLTSLKHGILSVLELSKLTKINRQKIYEESEKLVEMGLYDITRKQRRKYISAVPMKLLKLGEEKINKTQETLKELSGIIPQLESMPASKKNKVVVKYYEGIGKIKEVYKEELEMAKNTEVLSLAGSIDDIFKFFPESYWEEWNKKFVKQGSKTRMLVHKSDAARETTGHDNDYKRETRYIDNFSLKVNIDIFGENVLLVSFYDEIAILINSQILSQSYRIMFETLWGMAKSFK
ncbi:MAG: hypothetical protein A2427_00520 [Candidatus Nealsonbacteria bacterium RIFOXYC1_FULL_40_7]|uniref:Transcription regulator TrmB N-terminal domain-containing protein n=2 Tax=Candidatus Nealsoniibacteriota TaxID=1817911 RepID=A0A1G2ELX8_9BACT|nr:MAG: hypothetical protein A2427_00520 [Candidatus Nealsonbacteria bacterium RIFOXYC1_FULL_40_7]OGZ28281.1 MAG: hypothetical protein A2562_04390 [Candidatus Nealsonbacteria bacterium RIFOXYD1_FULL_39_11]